MSNTMFLFEGAAAGTSATVGNTGASVINKAGGTQFFTNAAAAHGTCGLEITTTTASQYNIARFLAAAANNQQSGSFVFSYAGAGTGGVVTADSTICKVRQNVSETGVISFNIRNVSGTDKFRIVDASSNALATGTELSVTPNTKYRATWVLTGGSTTAGVVTVRLRNFSDDSLIGTFSSTTANLTANTPNGAEWGCISANQSGLVVRIDDIQINDGGNTELAAYTPPSNVAPVVPPIATQLVTPGATVTITPGATDSDGTVTGHAWSWVYPSSGAPTLSGATSATVSFTAGAVGSVYILQYIATDNGGASSSPALAEVRVPSSAATVGSLYIDSVGGWTRTGGSTDGEATGDDSDSTYLTSPTLSTTETKTRNRFKPVVNRDYGSVTVRLNKTDSGSANVTVRIFSTPTSTTVIDSYTITPTTTITDYPHTLSSSALAALGTDWSGISIEVGATT